MSRAGKNRGRLAGGPIGISGQLWHYDGSNAYREVDDLPRRRRARERFEAPTVRSGGYMSRLTRFMSAGGMRHEKSAEEENTPRDSRGRVVKWLAALSVIWVVFRFVEL
jgi:hypothetical protein